MANDNERENTVVVDRGTMEPIDKKSNQSKAKQGLLLFFMVIAGAAYFILSGDDSPTPKEDDPYFISTPSSKNLEIKEAELDLPPEPPPPPPAPPEVKEELPEQTVTIAEIREDNSILQRRMSSGFSGLRGSVGLAQADVNANQDEINPNALSSDKPSIEEYDGQGVAKVTASRIINRSLVITQGAKIPCTLETALDSNVPGMTSCIVSDDIYSSDGLVRLIDRGSKLNGRYQGDMKRGQARIAILWERLETPEGVLINLSSPSTDQLGRAGAGGFVDKHFFERFGNAIMLSLVSDAFQYLNYKQSEDGLAEHFQDTQESTQNMAEIALENEISIAPTLHKNQGESIMVFLNKDLSFEEVYELEMNATDTDPMRERLYEYLSK